MRRQGAVALPYQSLGDEVDAQIRRRGGMAVSLRQMCAELHHLDPGPLALRSPNQRSHRLARLELKHALREIPPCCRLAPRGRPS
jgi:hypothetical protein